MLSNRTCFALLLTSLSLTTVYARATGHASSDQSALHHLDAQSTSRSLIGIQYEHWFYGPQSWSTAEAVPLLGKYTTDEQTVSRHFQDFHDLGIDWLLIDWTNMLWMKPAWEQHAGETHMLEEKTDVLFKTSLDLQRQQKYAPKLVFMLGLQNGPPVQNGVARLNAILAWVQARYLNRPEYKDLWLYDNGKPLLTILYWPPDPCAQLSQDLAAHSLHTEAWTVRWMSTQLQDNHANRCGMWSWMDGVIPQVVTTRNGRAEEVVVTPSSFRFPGKGWTDPSAIGRDHGVPYLQSWRIAFERRPKFIQIHQWNEFAGQKNGQGMPLDYWGQHPSPKNAQKPQRSDAYGDEYNLNLSDDIEPTDLHSCTYRGCGGWGYYYVNLTKAVISLYRGETPGITVLALSGPPAEQSITGTSLNLHWDFLGQMPSSYSLYLDGKLVSNKIQGKQYMLDLSKITPGQHHIKLIANGADTFFDLNPARRAIRSSTPLPVESEIAFRYEHP